MPITFDTLEELKAFYRAFKLDEEAAAQTKSKKAPSTEEAKPAKRKPGRKPGLKTAVANNKKTSKKPTRKPITAKASSNGKGRPKATLTAKIQDTIQKNLDEKRAFTASDIYDTLAKRDKGVNKQSVVTSVLKQMNTTFANTSVTERPGAGPRPVKVYNAK